MNECPRLIEVALPIREISAESVRDKSLRHGHISTLHLWWARRPLAASRAVVFASLVPDPEDPRCPKEFRDAVEHNLKTHVPSVLKHYQRGRETIWDGDPYQPYEDIPDTLRNRLLAFVAKWSPEALAFETGKSSREPKPAQLLDDRSLVKWETSDPENMQGQAILEIARQLVYIAYEGRAPIVLDPFAGGGAIPLEAGRLGCQPIANDYNPVAYLILRGTCEFPQKYGKPGKRKILVEEFGQKVEREVEVPNVLVHDVEKWAKWILKQARKKIGHLYPPGKDGRPVIGYLWARTAPCSNPSCRCEMPLLRSLLVCNKRDKKTAISLKIDKVLKTTQFEIVKGKSIRQTKGTKRERGPVICPFCNQPTSETDLRKAGQEGQMGAKIVAVIVENNNGKDYRAVEEEDINTFHLAKTIKIVPPSEPIEEGQWNIKTWLYGMKTWGSLFNPRQLLAMQTLVDSLGNALEEIKVNFDEEGYQTALGIYLGLWLSRTSMFLSNVGLWKPSGEFIAAPFSKQAIPIVWDYPEINPFAQSSGCAIGQLDWITRVLKHEVSKKYSALVFRGDASTIDIANKSLDCVVTDPPYFDSIAYADLSDYFYVWLKRAIDQILPENFITPLTPKDNEATALKHRHSKCGKEAERHFIKKLTQILIEAKRKLRANGLLSIMFAHQSTNAWISLIQAMFGAGLNIDATWPIETEREVRSLAIGNSALASSITVVCRPRITGTAASFKDVRKEIHQVVQESVKRFWSYGFRGADLIVACYGPAVGVFGKYERVEKADGTLVEIPELLELARKAARDAIAGEFRGDNLSTLYYVWANLYGAVEQAWDDARLVVQVGGESDNAIEMDHRHTIFIVNGSKCRLALLNDRADRRGLGLDQNPPLIDSLHRSMLLWKEEKRSELVSYLQDRDLFEDGPFWNLAQALFEVLPHEIEDWKLIKTLLGERQTLRTEARTLSPKGKQLGLFTD